MTVALITGIEGSGASYLAEYLVSIGVEVHGLARWHSTSVGGNLKNVADKIKRFECDMNDLSSVFRSVKESNPDFIFHMASHANVHACFNNPIAVMNNNIAITVNLFEAVRMLGIDPVIQFCGTSEVYGLVTRDECPIFESARLNPVNPYAVSKLTQEKIAYCYYRSFGIKSVLTRMFAYINPRRKDIFSSSFARQVVEIEKGKKGEIIHGNLDSTRTLIDVRDMAESYWVASQKCDYGVPYNIGGVSTLSVGDFLDILKKKSSSDIKSRVEPSLLRPIDVTMQIPDVSLFTEKTGWTPKYTLEDSIEFLLEHYREEVK